LELACRLDVIRLQLPPAFAAAADRIAKAWARARRVSAQIPEWEPRNALCAYALACRALIRATTRTIEPFVFERFGADRTWLDHLAHSARAHPLDEVVQTWVETLGQDRPEDLLRPLYERLIPRRVRRELGEVYTPLWLAEHVVKLVWSPNETWLDPCAGCGSFALALARCGADKSERWVRFSGIEANPWAALAATATASLAESWLTGSRVPLRVDAVIDTDLTQHVASTGRYSRIIGNPPWVLWDNLPDEWLCQSADQWRRYGLLAESGMGSILGGSKKDLAMLMTYIAADRYLEDGGRLAFVMTISALKSTSSGRGFRRWRLPNGCPLRVLRVDDLSRCKPFPDASGKAAVIVLEKGSTTRYPVPFFVWPRIGSAPIEQLAEPVDSHDPLTPWRHGDRQSGLRFRRIVGKSYYRAHLGVNTGGANGVYFFRRIRVLSANLWRMQNLSDSGKREVEQTIVDLEPALLFPMLLGRDVRCWAARPSAWVLLVQDLDRRRGIDPDELRRKAPNCLAYLQRFEVTLRRRAALVRYFMRPQVNGPDRLAAPYYSMFNVGRYSGAQVKVVWNRMGRKLAAAVVSTSEGKPVQAQETHGLIALDQLDEAYYLAALLNSCWAQWAVAAMGALGGKSFATPGTIQRLELRPYDRSDPLHRELAGFGRAASDAAANGIVANSITPQIDRLVAQYWRVAGHKDHDDLGRACW
jgi:hypothetical protein